MAKPGKTKQTKGVDIVIILLVTVLLLFGLVALLNVLSDPFDGTEVGLEGFLSRLKNSILQEKSSLQTKMWTS